MAIFSCVAGDQRTMAAEGGGSHYLQGTYGGFGMALSTPPGFYVRNDVIYMGGEVGAFSRGKSIGSINTLSNPSKTNNPKDNPFPYDSKQYVSRFYQLIKVRITLQFYVSLKRVANTLSAHYNELAYAATNRLSAQTTKLQLVMKKVFIWSEVDIRKQVSAIFIKVL